MVKLEPCLMERKNEFQSRLTKSTNEITGLMEVPLLGDKFVCLEDERQTRQISEETIASKRR